MKPPADDQLLAYLDGELPPADRAEVEQQLAASWELRMQLARLQRDLELYMQESPVVAEPELPLATAVWADLRMKLTRTRRSKPRSIWISGGVGVIAAAIVVAAIVRVTSPPTISAADVLDRARRAEAAESGASVRPVVVHQRLRVRRTGPARGDDQSVVWDVWRASGTVARASKARKAMPRSWSTSEPFSGKTESIRTGRFPRRHSPIGGGPA